MRTPMIPSFFKTPKSRSFDFKTRYYDKTKERREQLEKGAKANIKFNRKHTKNNQKARNIRIIFLFIVLSLLAYKLVIN
tara:strand:- start:4 stop:240 length:237 start_codon:yes stop_codon:yes gene_type:complete